MSMNSKNETKHIFSKTKVKRLPEMTWTKDEVTGFIPGARQGHTCHLIKNELYIVGGMSHGERCNGIIKYEFNTKHWKDVVVKGKSPPTTCYHAACTSGSFIYVFGGEVSRNSGDKTDIENEALSLLKNDENYKTFCVDTLRYFDTCRRTWVVPDIIFNPIPCKSASLCILGNEGNESLVTFGGCASGSLCPIGDINRIFISDLNKKNAKWEQLLPTGKRPSSRFGHSCVKVNKNKMLIYGGYDGKHLCSDMYIYLFIYLIDMYLIFMKMHGVNQQYVDFYLPLFIIIRVIYIQLDMIQYVQ